MKEPKVNVVFEHMRNGVAYRALVAVNRVESDGDGTLTIVLDPEPKIESLAQDMFSRERDFIQDTLNTLVEQAVKVEIQEAFSRYLKGMGGTDTHYPSYSMDSQGNLHIIHSSPTSNGPSHAHGGTTFTRDVP